MYMNFTWSTRYDILGLAYHIMIDRIDNCWFFQLSRTEVFFMVNIKVIRFQSLTNAIMSWSTYKDAHECFPIVVTAILSTWSWLWHTWIQTIINFYSGWATLRMSLLDQGLSTVQRTFNIFSQVQSYSSFSLT